MIREHAPLALHTLRADYLQALANGDHRCADRTVERALEAGVSVGDIYLELMQPSAYAIGRLWQHNCCSVGQEHRATAIIEHQMADLHCLFRPEHLRPHTIVIGCVPDEWHRVGAHMVADFFEADGWTVYFLGASTPIDSLVAIVRETGADLIGLSAGMLFNLPQVAEFTRVLERRGLGGIPLLVGGLPFGQNPSLAEMLNVSGCVPDARAAVQVANELMHESAPRAGAVRHQPTLAALRGAHAAVVAAAAAVTVADEGDPAAEPLILAGFEMIARMVEAAMVVEMPGLLDEQIRWVNVRQPHDGVLPDQILSRLIIYADVVRRTLDPPHSEATGLYLDRLIARQREAVGV